MEAAFPPDAKSKLPPVVVLGAGYVGGAVARHAVSQGHPVYAVTRNQETAAALQASGVTVAVATLQSDAWHQGMPSEGARVVLCVSSGGGGNPVAYRTSYYEGALSVSRWLEARGACASLAYTSSTSVYSQGNGALVSEDSPAEPATENGCILRETEKVILEHCCAEKAAVFRLSGIYGPTRHPLLDQLREGVSSLPGKGEHRLNLIHRDDIVRAVWQFGCHSGGGMREIFNLSDGNPERKDLFVKWLCDRIGRPVPSFSGEVTPGRRALVPDRVIQAEKIRRVLGWAPSFPSFREGYEAILGA